MRDGEADFALQGLLGAVVTPADIAADAVEPGGDTMGIAQPLNAAPGFEHRLLNHVVSALDRNALQACQSSQVWFCLREEAFDGDDELLLARHVGFTDGMCHEVAITSAI
jgi:hypothetical protein